MEKRGVDADRARYSSPHNRFGPRAQTGAEFIVLMAFVLIILLGIIALNQGLLDSFSGQFRGQQAKIVVNDLGDAADSVYFQGVGAQTKVLVSIPKGVIYTGVQNNTIRLNLDDGKGGRTDVYRNTNYIVVGHIPTTEGNYWITVKAHPGYVTIGYSLIELVPSSVSIQLSPGDTDYFDLIIKKLVDDDVSVRITPSSSPYVGITANETAILLTGPDRSVEVGIIVPGSTPEGFYPQSIDVYANTSDQNESYTIPVDVTVALGGTCTMTNCSSLFLFPELWDVGVLGPNSLNSSAFLVCNNKNVPRSVNLGFSNSTYLGFDPGVTQKTSTLSLPAANCVAFTVYINSSGATNSTWFQNLTASSNGEQDSSLITYRIVINTSNTTNVTGPQVILISPPEGNVSIMGNISFRYNVTDANFSILYCQLFINGSNRSRHNNVTRGIVDTFNVTNLGEGSYNWTVSCNDTNGQSGNGGLLHFTIGVPKPVVSLISPPDGATIMTGNLSFTYNVTDQFSNISNCTLYVNNINYSRHYNVPKGVTDIFTYVGLSDGSYTWTVNCTNKAGKTGTGGIRSFTLNASVVYATPSMAWEEDFDPTWNGTPFVAVGDGLTATALDELGSLPDYVEFQFPPLGLGNGKALKDVIFTFTHYDDPQGGHWDEDYRHEFMCYNGINWVYEGTYPPNELTWSTFWTNDLSQCIDQAGTANNIHIRVMYDPAVDAGGTQTLDFAQIRIDLTQGIYPNLWPMAVDSPHPVDFTSGLNTTANTFGLGVGDDGWDWRENAYGGSVAGAVFNVDPNDDGNIADSTVASNDRIEIRVGGGAPGAPSSANNATGIVSSGSYGVQFNITPAMYNAMADGRSAFLSFDWATDADAGWGTAMGSGYGGWVKARFTKSDGTIYWFGSNNDANATRKDNNLEVWYQSTPVDDAGHENYDVTSFITAPGTYYLDLGAAVGRWSSNRQGMGAYFDNVQMMIK